MGTHTTRRFATALAVAALAAGATAAGASASTVKIHSKTEHAGLFVFKVKKLRRGNIVAAVMRVGSSKRRVSVNRIRRAVASGTFRARAPRHMIYTWHARAARARKPRATLIVTSTGGTSTTTTQTSSGSGSGTSTTGTTTVPGTTPTPNSSCNAPFSAGNWPGACWRPYSDSSPWNRPIPANPRLMSNSSSVVSKVLSFGSIGNLSGGATDATDDWGHPTYYPTSTDPVFTLHCLENWGRCDIEGMQVRIPDAAKPASGGDGHMTVVDQPSGWEYDFWQVESKPGGGGTLTMSWGGRTRIDGDGLGSAATAAGYGNLAGIIRAPELMSGQINHALFMVVKCDSGSYVYPAEKNGRACSDIGISGADAPPMGTRFQLAMSDDQIAALNVPPYKKTILTAMAHYGMYFGDTGGGSWGLQMESPATYTSFSVADPMLDWAKTAPGVTMWNGDWVLNLKDGVDWARYLRVVDPCVSQGTC